MRIYLDFDGCMHRTTPDKVPFEHIEAFEAILRDNPEAHVVISSSWREEFSLGEMRGYFAEDVGRQIVDVTPILTGDWRYDEVTKHVRDTRYGGDYVVVDDNHLEFPESWAPLLLCDPTRGLDAEKQEELRARLRHAARRNACNELNKEKHERD